MGDSWIERTAIALLLMLLMTLGNQLWFRVEHAAAAVTTRMESPKAQRKEIAPPISTEREECARMAAAIGRFAEAYKASGVTCPL